MTLMVNKAESLRTTSKQYYSSSKKVRCAVLKNKYKLTALIIAILLVNF